MDEGQRQALAITAEENYAHARDHEHLRAQITSILVGASFVLIGLAIENLSGAKLLLVSAMVIAIGILNLWLIQIHTNRFDRHVDVAREAKSNIGSLSEFKLKPSASKLGNLKRAWQLVACLPIVAGVVLLLMELKCT